MTSDRIWLAIGLCGQAVFTARFLVQWVASERRRDSVMPVAFWWLSLTGGLVTLIYAVHLQSVPFMLGQSMGLFVYVRNLMLVGKAKKRQAKRQAREMGAAVPRPHGPRDKSRLPFT